MIKSEDFIPIADRKDPHPDDMYLLYAPPGNYAFVAGRYLEETIKQSPAIITHFYDFAEHPIVIESA